MIQITSEKDLTPEMVGRSVLLKDKDSDHIEARTIKRSRNFGILIGGNRPSALLERFEIYLIPTLAESLERDKVLESMAKALNEIKGFASWVDPPEDYWKFLYVSDIAEKSLALYSALKEKSK